MQEHEQILTHMGPYPKMINLTLALALPIVPIP